MPRMPSTSSVNGTVSNTKLIKKLSSKLLVALRMEKARPVHDTFHMWLTDTGFKAPPRGLLGNAIGYPSAPISHAFRLNEKDNAF